MNQRLWVWCVTALFAAFLAGSVAGCGCNQEGAAGIGPVKAAAGWIVGFATDVGEWVVHTATNFADAVSRAWVAFWGTAKVSNVIVDAKDALRGVYDGLLVCKVEWASSGPSPRSNKLEVELDHPRMVRSKESETAWQLAPEEQAKLKELQQQLLEAH